MKKYLILLLAVVALAVSCNDDKKEAEVYPMFWTWLEDLPDVDMEASFKAMHEAGIDGVMLHAASNDKVYATFALYEGGLIDKETLIKELKSYKLVDQYLFHTEKALEFLSYIAVEEITI